MGRKKRKRNKKRMAHQFHEHAARMALDRQLVSEEHRSHQSNHVKRIRELEKEILSKTIFVTHVQDLNKDHNLHLLQAFFEQQYGPVSKCQRVSTQKRKSGRHFPGARVSFQFSRDAERIFGRSRLSDVREPALLPCALGYKGPIRVQPSHSYAGMTMSKMDDSAVEFNTLGLGIGHWFGLESEMLPPVDGEDLSPDEFMEAHHIYQHFEVRINLSERTVEIRSEARNHDEMFGLFSLGRTRTDILSFRFKHIQYPARIYACQGSRNEAYSIVLPMRCSPKLEVEFETVDCSLEVTRSIVRKRSVHFCGLSASCFGDGFDLKLEINREMMDRLWMKSTSIEKLVRFGVFQDGIDSFENVQPVNNSVVGERSQEFLWALGSTTSMRLGEWVKILWH